MDMLKGIADGYEVMVHIGNIYYDHMYYFGCEWFMQVFDLAR